MNSKYFPKVHISEGLRFPSTTISAPIFLFYLFYPIHTHVNIIHVLLGLHVLNRQYGVRLGLEDVLYVYTIK